MSDCLMVVFLYNNGKEEVIYMSEKSLDEWEISFMEGKRYVVKTGKDRIGLSPDQVARWKLYSGQTEFFSKPLDHMDVYAQGFKEAKAEKIEAEGMLCKVECKCGNEYSYRAPIVRNTDTCSKCGAKLYTDYQQGWIKTDEGEARLITNRYRVDKTYWPRHY